MLKNKDTIKQFIKYILISVVGYSFVFVFLYILVDILLINKIISFVIVYTISYLMLYKIQLKLLFQKKHNSKRIIKFISSLLFFYLLANFIFYFYSKPPNIHYLTATALTIITVMPIRFIVSKFIVFK